MSPSNTATLNAAVWQLCTTLHIQNYPSVLLLLTHTTHSLLRMPFKELRKDTLEQEFSSQCWEHSSSTEGKRQRWAGHSLTERLQIRWWKRSAFPSTTRREKGCTRVLCLFVGTIDTEMSQGVIMNELHISITQHPSSWFRYHYLKCKIARYCMCIGEWTLFNPLAFWFL